MKNHKTIYDLLESWGRSKRETPQNNDNLKSEVLSKAPIFQGKITFRRSPFLLMPFSFTALAILVFLFNFSVSPNGINTIVTSYNQPSTKVIDTITGNSPKSSSPIIPPSSNIYNAPSSSMSAPSMNATSAPSFQVQEKPSAMQTPPVWRTDETAISDNREFLKINYNATLQTRHVADTKTEVEAIVRSLGGRVDSSGSTDKSGYVGFAVPKENMEIFKLEIKNLVGEKFYAEYLDSQNFLPQKQVIEENQKQTEKSINSLKNERALVEKNYNQTVSSYQKSADSLQAQIAALNFEYQSATYSRRIEIENMLRQLQGQVNAIQLHITEENENYRARVGQIDANIKSINATLAAIRQEDKNLLQNVATVNGLISLDWISLWEMADIYTPGPLLSWIFLALAIVSCLWYWRQSTKVSHNYF